MALTSLKRYLFVTVDVGEVAQAQLRGSGFAVCFTTGETIHSRRLLLATGLFDELPKVPAIENYFKDVQLASVAASEGTKAAFLGSISR